MCAAKPKNSKQLLESGTQSVHVHPQCREEMIEGEAKRNRREKNDCRNRSREINSSQFDSYSRSLCLSFHLIIFCLQRFSFPSLVFVFKTFNFLIILSMNKAYSCKSVLVHSSSSFFSRSSACSLFFL